jgi:hypothetical protein
MITWRIELGELVWINHDELALLEILFAPELYFNFILFLFQTNDPYTLTLTAFEWLHDCLAA